MQITFSSTGDFNKANTFLQKLLDGIDLSILDKYGKRGVELLSAATPVDSGKTASCWTYKTTRSKTGCSLEFLNTNINKGVNIAIILQLGHGTGTGGYVVGRDYINPVCQPLFDELANEAWKEVSSS